MKKLVKTGILLAAIVVFVSLLAFSAGAQEVVDRGECGNNITWTFDSEGTLTFSGTGKMELQQVNTWSGYLNSMTTLVFENGITSIPERAFNGCANLESIVMADTITDIGYSTFRGCEALTDVKLSNNLETIPAFVFSGCSALSTIRIPRNVTFIDDGAFLGCSNLERVTMYDNILYISGRVFQGCSKLEDIDIPHGIKVVDSEAYVGTGYYNNPDNWDNGSLYYGNILLAIDENYAGDYVVDDSVEHISLNVFDNYIYRNAGKIIISEDNQRYSSDTSEYLYNKDKEKIFEYLATGSYASVDSITVPEQVKTVGAFSFQNINTNSIDLPDGITTIEAGAFYACSDTETINIPNSVTSIGDNAFNRCYALQSLNILSNVTHIGKDAFFWCASWATQPFTIYGCYKSYAETYAEENNIRFVVIDNYYIVTGISQAYLLEKGLSNYANIVSIKTGEIREFIITNDNKPVSVNDIVVLDNGMVSKIPVLTKYTLETEPAPSFNEGRIFVCDFVDYDKVSNFLTFKTRGQDDTNHDFILSEDANILYYRDNSKHEIVDNSILDTSANNPYEDLQDGFKMLVVAYQHPGVPDTLSIIDSIAVLGKNCPNYNNYGITAKGECGTNLTWTLYDDGELVISGTGKMTDWETGQDTPWYEYLESIEKVTIEDGVTTIGDNAFYCCVPIEEVSLAESIVSVGDFSFESCYNLREMKLPKNVKTIGDYAFENCISLETVVIPEGVTEILSGTFRGCEAMLDITIPKSLTKIGKYAFEECYKTNVHISDIAAWCNIDFENQFANPLREGLYLGDKLITELVIPDGVETISNYAFNGCKNLESLTLADSVKTIGKNAFENCTFERVSLGKGLNYICDGAFGNCRKLTGISFPEGLIVIENDAFISCRKIPDIDIPDSVVTLGNSAFENCSSIETVKIGKGVTIIGADVFSDCDSLLSISVNADNQHYSSKNGVLFNKSKTTLITYPVGISLEKYIVPVTVTNIANGAFRNCIFSEITLPDGLITIGEEAFGSCAKLETIKLPDSVKAINEHAFTNCESLFEVTFGKDIESIGRRAFFNCESLKSITLHDGAKTIGASAFYKCTNLKTAIIPESVTTIEDGAFDNCYGLTIYGKKVSAAHVYALENNIDFVEYPLSEEHDVIIITAGIAKITKNDKVTALSVAPVIVSDELMVPVRALFESLVATLEWNNETRTFTSELGNTKISLTIDDKTIYVNGQGKPIDVPAQIINDRTIVPAMAIVEAFELDYEWDSDTGTLTIYVSAEMPDIPDTPKEKATISIVNAKGKPGETVKVSVELSGNTGILGMVLKLSYDENLSVVSVSKGTDFSNLTLTTSKNLNTNPLRLVFDAETADYSDGTLLNIEFKISEDADDGDYGISLSCESAYDADENEIDFNFEDGAVTVVSYIPGDVNGDGNINTLDITALRRHIAGGYNVVINPDAADVNKDGKINTLDITNIRRHLAGGYGVVLK